MPEARSLSRHVSRGIVGMRACSLPTRSIPSTSRTLSSSSFAAGAPSVPPVRWRRSKCISARMERRRQTVTRLLGRVVNRLVARSMVRLHPVRAWFMESRRTRNRPGLILMFDRRRPRRRVRRPLRRSTGTPRRETIEHLRAEWIPRFTRPQRRRSGDVLSYSRCAIPTVEGSSLRLGR